MTSAYSGYLSTVQKTKYYWVVQIIIFANNFKQIYNYNYRYKNVITAFLFHFEFCDNQHDALV